MMCVPSKRTRAADGGHGVRSARRNASARDGGRPSPKGVPVMCVPPASAVEVSR